MKIVRKEIWTSDGVCHHSDVIIGYSNCSNEWGTVSSFFCGDLSGSFYGFGRNMETQIRSYIDFSSNNVQEHFATSVELNLIPPDFDEDDYFRNPEVWENYELKSIQIPDDTNGFVLHIAPRDYVRIEAKRTELFVLVDDVGNEISLDRLVLRD